MKKRIRNVWLSFISVGFLLAQRSAFCQQASSEAGKEIFSDQATTVKKIIDLVTEFIVKYSFQALGGLVVIFMGFVASRMAARAFSTFLEKQKVDVTVIKFLVQILKIIILALAVLVALGSFGITIAPFIAGLSVAGFGLSFAMQGPLSNYAAGVTLIFTKPFKVGDIIEVTGVVGEVEDMTLAMTRVVTVDGTIINIPNKHIIGEIIHNYSEFKKLDIKVGVGYGSDVQKAIELVNQIIRDDTRIAQKPQPKAGIFEFGDSSINIYARVWSRQADYWNVLFSVNKAILERFKKEGIEIPFQQRDVHLYHKKAEDA